MHTRKKKLSASTSFVSDKTVTDLRERKQIYDYKL